MMIKKIGFGLFSAVVMTSCGHLSKKSLDLSQIRNGGYEQRDASGKLKEYTWYSQDTIKFTAYYDKQGELDSISGRPILMFSPRPKILIKGDSISFKAYLIAPPNTFKSLVFGYYDKDFNTLQQVEVPFEDCYASFKILLTDPIGQYYGLDYVIGPKGGGKGKSHLSVTEYELKE